LIPENELESVSTDTESKVELGGDPGSLRRHEDRDGLLRTQQHVHELIQKEIDAGIPADHIVLGGFSQGGAASIFSGLTAKVKLAGIVALSAYLMLSQQFKSFVPNPNVNKDTPVFMGHGEDDQVVPHQLGKMSCEILQGLGYQVRFESYPDLGHSATPEELESVERFLTEVLPNADAKAPKEKPEL